MLYFEISSGEIRKKTNGVAFLKAGIPFVFLNQRKD